MTAVVVVTGAISVIAVTALARNHDLAAGLAAPVHRFADAVEPGDAGRPIVVTTEVELPRLSWRTMAQQRWLLVDPEDLGQVLARLATGGVDQVVLVTGEPGEIRDSVEGGPWHPAAGWPTHEGDGWWMDRLVRS